MPIRIISCILFLLLLVNCDEKDFTVDSYIIGNRYENHKSDCTNCSSWIEFTDEKRAVVYFAGSFTFYDATYEVIGNSIYLYDKTSRRRILTLTFINKDLLKSWAEEWFRI